MFKILANPVVESFKIPSSSLFSSTIIISCSFRRLLSPYMWNLSVSRAWSHWSDERVPANQGANLASVRIIKFLVSTMLIMVERVWFDDGNNNNNNDNISKQDWKTVVTLHWMRTQIWHMNLIILQMYYIVW